MKNKQISFARRREIAGWLFISPFAVGFLLFFLQPLVKSLYYSFCNLQLTDNGFTKTWSGLANYEYAFIKDSTYIQQLLASLQNMAVQTPVILLFSLFVAVILNQRFHGRFLARSVFFLPVIITSGIVMSIIQSDILGDSIRTGETAYVFQGVSLEKLLLSVSIPSSVVTTFMGVVNSIFDMLWRSGVQILLFLAALQGISPPMYEAAKMEGATGWECFWKITLPMISPIFLLNITYTIIDSFTDYNNTVMLTIQNMAFTQWRYAYSCALAWVFFAMAAAVIGIVNAIVSRFVFYYE